MALADIVWPGLYIVGSRYATLAVLLSLLLEWLIYWPATKAKWWVALAATVAVNAVSMLFGLVFACLSMFASVPFQTFSTSDWVVESLFIGALTAVVEWATFLLLARKWPSLKVRFRWVLIANILSTFLCVRLAVPEFDVRKDYIAPPKGMGIGVVQGPETTQVFELLDG